MLTLMLGEEDDWLRGLAESAKNGRAAKTLVKQSHCG